MSNEERRKIARIIGWNAWLSRYKLEHPNATEVDIQLAWKEARDYELKSGVRAIHALNKAGYSIST